MCECWAGAAGSYMSVRQLAPFGGVVRPQLAAASPQIFLFLTVKIPPPLELVGWLVHFTHLKP